MFARTKRLTLRPWWPEEALIAAAMAESGALRRAMAPDGAGPGPGGGAEPRFAILSHDPAPGGGGMPWLAGEIALVRAGGVGTPMLHGWLVPAARGRGYMAEAGRIVLEGARTALGLRRIVAGHRMDDPAARHVLETLGFREIAREHRAAAGPAPIAIMACDLAAGAGPDAGAPAGGAAMPIAA